VNQVSPGGLVPPRPNLGPEPWREPGSITGVLLVVGILTVLVPPAVFLLRRQFGAAAQAKRSKFVAGGSSRAEHSPQDNLVALSDSIRTALILKLGMACRAKTTEELSADARLEQLLGDQGRSELIRFLDRIDRLKFALPRADRNDEALQQMLSEWEPRIVALRERIQTNAPGRDHDSRRR